VKVSFTTVFGECMFLFLLLRVVTDLSLIVNRKMKN